MVKKTRKIHVFGASGFIGGHIAHSLEQQPETTVLAYSSKDCDLLDPSAVSRALQGCDEETSVIICSTVQRSVDNSWRSLSKNIAMAHNVAQSIPDTGLRSLIFLSSADVYGKQIKHLPITEETIPNPDSYYAVSKLMSEQILTLELAGKGPVSILRPPGVYGPGDGFKSTIGHFVLSTLEKEPIYIFGTGRANRDYVTVSDFTEVIDRLLETPYDGVLNVATGTSVEIRELIALIGEHSGVEQDIQYNPQFDEGSGDLIFDTARLKSVCHGIEFAGVSEGIAEYLKILRQPV